MESSREKPRSFRPRSPVEVLAMVRHSLVVLVVILMVAGSALAQRRPMPEKPRGPGARGERPAPRQQWEYRTLSRDAIAELGNKDLNTGLNKLGEEGWELVALAADANLNRKGSWAEYYFKRPKDAGARAEAKPDKPQPETRTETQILTLKFARATDMARILAKLFGDKDIAVGCDERTNSLVVKGSPKVIDELATIVAKLDQPAEPGPK